MMRGGVSKANGIVRLTRMDNGQLEHVGLGVLCDERTVVTCAHVVNVCLERHPLLLEKPATGATLTLTFPIFGDTVSVEAVVTEWSPPGTEGLDCAVLKLKTAAPQDVVPTVLTVLEADDPDGHRLSVYNSPSLGYAGRHMPAQLTGQVGAGRVQLAVDDQNLIEEGMSGGRVWDEDERASIGIVMAVAHDGGGTAGYFLDAGVISRTFGKSIPVEIRRIPIRRQVLFTFLSLLLFGLILVHHLAQSDGAKDLLPWVKGDTRLAAFFGAHCFAVILGPVVMWSAYTHARSFARRPMWQRVPALFAQGPGDAIENTRMGAFSVALFLLLLPCLAQGRAMDEAFFQTPQIYVHAESFVAEKDAFFGCDAEGGTFCHHAHAGLWLVMGRCPYWDTIYRYAGRDCSGDNCGGPPTVTFFPILQPAILMIGTALGFGWFLLFVYAVLRPWPYPTPSRNFERNVI